MAHQEICAHRGAKVKVARIHRADPNDCRFQTPMHFSPEPIPESVRKAMRKRGVNLEPGATFAQALVKQMWLKAMVGDSKAAKEIRESIEGKAAQRPADPGDKDPVTFHVVYDYEKRSVPPKPDLGANLGPDQDTSTK